MRLATIQWSNFRRLPDGVIKARNHVVLIGPNDTGKSSIVHALNMCLGMSTAQLQAAIGQRDFSDPLQPLLVTVTLDGLTMDERAAFPDEVTVGPPEVLTMSLEVRLDPNDPEQRDVRRFFPDSGHQRPPSKDQLKAIAFAYVPAARSLYRELSGKDGTVRKLFSSLELGPDADALNRALGEYRNALDASPVLQSFRNTVAQELSSALPTIVSNEDVRIQSEAEMLDNPLSSVALTIRDGTHDVPLNEQSDGIRALSLLTLLSLSHKSAQIVAVDEPETHLHPVAQRAVARALQAAQTQRIIVTHSPDIVARMDPLDIVAFSATKVAKQLPTTALIAHDDAQIRHWSYRFLEPLTARHVILVEGPSDRILLERTAMLANLDLDRKGVAICELGSAQSFPLAYSLFGPAGFGLSLRGLLDEDARALWAATIGCAPNELAGRGFQVCNPNLEAHYISTFGVTRVAQILATSQSIGSRRLLDSCDVADIGAIDSVKLLTFCTKSKYKVPSALALGQALAFEDLPNLAPLHTLVAEFC